MARYQLEPVRSDLTAVGTDGKTYIISLYYFNQTKGNIPQDSEEKLNAAREAIKQKVAELNVGQVKYSKCFVLDSDVCTFSWNKLKVSWDEGSSRASTSTM